MVRPVEPDPPRPIPKAPAGVRGTTPSPEQLGQTPVREPGERPGGRKRSKPEKAEDTVTLQKNSEAPPEEPKPTGGSETTDRPNHLDVRG